MRKLIFGIIVLLFAVDGFSQGPLQNISMSPSSNFSYRDKRVVHNLIDNFNKWVYYPYGEYDFRDYLITGIQYSPLYKHGKYTLTEANYPGYNVLRWVGDSLIIDDTSQVVYYLRNSVQFIANDPVDYVTTYLNQSNALKTNSNIFTSQVFSLFTNPESGDTVKIDELINIDNNALLFATNGGRVDIGALRGTDYLIRLDDDITVDSVVVIEIDIWDTGISDDSIMATYGIYNHDRGPSPSTERKYFFYSEGGDAYLGGGGELDQVAKFIHIGGDVDDETTRTDALGKAGGIEIPHYTNSEEPFLPFYGLSSAIGNTAYVGGSWTDRNVATDIQFYTATDGTTLGPSATKIAEMSNDGLEITSGAYKQVQLTGSLTDGTPTDAEIDAIVGDTPANMGAGWTVTIKDNDGSGLMYRVESDGTNWGYQALTVAL